MYTQGASLATGPYAFTVLGSGAATPLNALTAGGVFSLNGGAISGENIDVNSAGTVTQGLTPTCSYTNPSGGRFTLSLGTLAPGIQNFSGYLTASQGVLLLETDGTVTVSALSGSFASGSNGRYVGSVTVTVSGTPYTLNEIFYAGANSNNTVLSLETDAYRTGAQSFQGPGVGLLQSQNLTVSSVSRPQDRAPNSATFKRAPSPGRAGEPPPPSQSLP